MPVGHISLGVDQVVDLACLDFESESGAITVMQTVIAITVMDPDAFADCSPTYGS